MRRAWLGDTFGLADSDVGRSLFEKVTAEATAVRVGPSSWLQSHVTSHANGIHALGYDSIPEYKKAMLAWLKGRRKSHLTWTHVTVDSKDKSNNLDALQSLLVRLVSVFDNSYLNVCIIFLC
jgi:hypothetical protein